MKKIITTPLLLFAFVSMAQPVSKTMKHLPDSGQNTSYTSVFGEDNDYSLFTPFYINNNDGTVTDTVTGLMWQRIDGGEMTFEAAKNYCDTLTLGGYADWRLPSIHEGFSLMNLDALNPAINTVYFPNSAAEYWWSKDKANNDTNKVWVTNSGGGKGAHPKSETISAGGTKKFHIRAVRDVVAPPIISNHFTANGDSTVTDNITNLMWTQYPASDSMTFIQALNYAEGLVTAGHSDWRLPNIKELASINNEQLNNPSVDMNYFTGLTTGKYWSSTSQFPNGTNAWFVDFQHYGLTSYLAKTNQLMVVAVRNKNSINDIDELHKPEIDIVISPNPATQCVNITIKAENETIEIVLTDITGKLVKEITIAQKVHGVFNKKIELEDLNKGLYFIQVHSRKGFVAKKIIVD